MACGGGWAGPRVRRSVMLLGEETVGPLRRVSRHRCLGGDTGNGLVDPRGWVSTDVTPQPRGKTIRFLNPHLESVVAPVRIIQAQELVDGPLRTQLRVIAVGDFNSPPTGPDSGAYQTLTERREREAA